MLMLQQGKGRVGDRWKTSGFSVLVHTVSKMEETPELDPRGSSSPSGVTADPLFFLCMPRLSCTAAGATVERSTVCGRMVVSLATVGVGRVLMYFLLP